MREPSYRPWHFLCLFVILKGVPTIFILLLPLAIAIADDVYVLACIFPVKRLGIFPGYSPDAGGDFYDLVLGDPDSIYR